MIKAKNIKYKIMNCLYRKYFSSYGNMFSYTPIVYDATKMDFVRASIVVNEYECRNEFCKSMAKDNLKHDILHYLKDSVEITEEPFMDGGIKLNGRILVWIPVGYKKGISS